MAKFPDFIVVGPMKTGTTAMWHNLNKHPKITMGKNIDDPKKTSTEIRFWASRKPYFNFQKGFDWYKNLFDGEVCGEKDAEMIDYVDAMKMLSIHSPKTKIILSVREPASRAYSAFQMSNRMKAKNTAFRKQFDRGGAHWRRGLYFKQIQERILPFFPAENLFVTVLEWMKNDTDKELNRIYNFLGVEDIHLNTVSQKFRERDTTITSYKNWNSGYPKILPKDSIYVKQKYKVENEKLFDFLGYEIKEWK